MSTGARDCLPPRCSYFELELPVVELEALVENKYFSGEFRGIVSDYEIITKYGIDVLWPLAFQRTV